MKRCSKCKEVKPDSDFIKDKRATTGLRCACRKCCCKSNTAWNRKNKDKYNAYRKKYSREKRAYSLVLTAKKRALKRKLPFDLDMHRDDIQKRIDAGFCEISGIPFDLKNGRTFASPSIDRIVPSKGYLYSNIRIICDSMNMALSDWGEEVLFAVVTSWIKQRKQKRSGVVVKDETSFKTNNINTSIVNVQA
jgi:hypothetical protein